MAAQQLLGALILTLLVVALTTADVSFLGRRKRQPNWRGAAIPAAAFTGGNILLTFTDLAGLQALGLGAMIAGIVGLVRNRSREPRRQRGT